MKTGTPDRGQDGPTCNVSSTFNFVVGGVAIAVVLVLVYLAFGLWWK
jgi:hypothetical protein